MKTALRALFAVAAAVSLCGCYSFAEVQRGSVVPGETVRVTLSADEAARQRDAIGELREMLEGRVVDADNGSSIGIAVPRRDASPADRADFNAFLTVPWSGITRLEQKRFNAGRTALFAAAGAAVGVAIVSLAGGGTGGDDEEPPNNSIVVPLLRFVVR